MSDIPREYEFRARNPKKNIIVGGPEIHSQPNAGCVFVQDIETGPRAATIKDYAHVQQLAQALDNCTIVGAHPVNPSDIADKYKHLSMCYEILKNTDKPMLGFGMAGWQAKQYLDMVDIAFGDTPGNPRHDQVCQVSLNPLSPLHFSVDTLDTLYEYASRGQGIYIFPHIMAGATGPIHLAGLGVLQNAEITASMVLGRLINPETPMVYSVASSTVCMRNIRTLQASPDLVRCNQFLLEMAHEFYNVPTRSQSGMTDSKIVDVQAGIEAGTLALFSALGDCDIIMENMGMMDNSNTTSLEMMVIANDILGRVKHMLKGIPINEDTLSFDIIKETGTRADYLMHSSTLENYHSDEYYQYDLCCAGEQPYAEWQNGGSLTMLDRAHQRMLDIWNNAEETYLVPDVGKDLKKYMKKCMDEG